MLVVAADLKKPVDDDMYVTVIGEVKRFSNTAIEQQLDGRDLDLRPDMIDTFNRRPVIIASSIRTADGEELLAGS